MADTHRSDPEKGAMDEKKPRRSSVTVVDQSVSPSKHGKTEPDFSTDKGVIDYYGASRAARTSSR